MPTDAGKERRLTGRRGAVVVSGASTGIGRATALLLASRGFRVYAGVRQEEDGAALDADSGGTVKPLMLDITNAALVEEAANCVRAELGALPFAGVVNNAGIVVAAPLEFVPLSDLREQFEVNVIGQVALAQAFLPLLRSRGGRLVFVGSVSGLVSTRLLGAYSASKFALEAVADAFRRELAPEVNVSLVEPGRFRTPIWDKSMRDGLKRLKKMAPEVHNYYGELIDGLMRGATQAAREGGDPAAVARVVARALTDKRPRTRYYVGSDAHLVNAIRRVTPDPLLDRLLRLTKQ